MDEVNLERLVVYTALFGDYDVLRDPVGKFSDVDFVCFTDQAGLVSQVWDIRLVPTEGRSQVELNRIYKFFPHIYLKEYSMSFYVDSNIQIKEKASELFRFLKNCPHTFVLPDHFARNCIYQEAEIIIKSKKGNSALVVSQMNSYKEDGFPENYGLTENNLIFRRQHDPKIIAAMEMWWEEFFQKTKRDQLSLMYVLWKLNIDYVTGVYSARRSPYFSVDLHKRYQTRFNTWIGYVAFKRFYDSNQPLNRFFDWIDILYGLVIQTR